MIRTFKTTSMVSPEEYERSRSGQFEDHRVALISAELRDVSGRQDPVRVLELGCGTGAIARRLASQNAQASFHGVDVDDGLLDYARAHDRLGLVTWSSELPESTLRTGIDLVYSIDVIHHLEDRTSMFSKVRDLLKPRGVWVAIEPNIWHPAISLKQERMKRQGLGEDHFYPRLVEQEWAGVGMIVHARRYAHLWPALPVTLPAWALALERRAENLKLLGGSVVYRLGKLSA